MSTVSGTGIDRPMEEYPGPMTEPRDRGLIADVGITPVTRDGFDEAP